MPPNDARAGSWVQKTPGVCGGSPCLRNTRHTVAGLVIWRRLRLDAAGILDRCPGLTPADLDAASLYYDQHREEIDMAIREDESAPPPDDRDRLRALKLEELRKEVALGIAQADRGELDAFDAMAILAQVRAKRVEVRGET